MNKYLLLKRRIITEFSSAIPYLLLINSRLNMLLKISHIGDSFPENKAINEPIS